MDETEPKVTPKQRVAIQTLIATGDSRQAAEAAGVAPKTLYTWYVQPAFKAALREAELSALEAFSQSLVSLAEEVTKTIRDGMKDPNIQVRLRAAGMALDGLLRVRELLTLEQRVSELEKSYGAAENTY